MLSVGWDAGHRRSRVLVRVHRWSAVLVLWISLLVHNPGLWCIDHTGLGNLLDQGHRTNYSQEVSSGLCLSRTHGTDCDQTCDKNPFHINSLVQYHVAVFVNFNFVDWI